MLALNLLNFLRYLLRMSNIILSIHSNGCNGNSHRMSVTILVLYTTAIYRQFFSGMAHPAERMSTGRLTYKGKMRELL